MSSEPPRENPYASPEEFGDAFRRGADAFGRPPSAGDDVIFAEGEITSRDYAAAISRARSRFHRALRAFVFVVAALALYGMFRALSGGASSLGTANRGVTIRVAVACCIVLALIVFGSWRGSRSFAAIRPEPIRYRLNARGIEIQTMFEYNLRSWNRFSRFRDQGEYLLLYLRNTKMFTFLPRRFFADDDWRRLLELVRDKLPPA